MGRKDITGVVVGERGEGGRERGTEEERGGRRKRKGREGMKCDSHLRSAQHWLSQRVSVREVSVVEE